MSEMVFGEVAAERKRQDETWGKQDHDLTVFMAILTEEVGEAAEQVLWNHFNKVPPVQLRKELVQVAAVAVAMIERIDRTCAEGEE